MFRISKPVQGIAIALALSGCEFMSDIPPSATVSHPHRAWTEAKSGPRKPSTWEDGIATYYDTDGDGLADKWVRDGWEYVDANHDGIPDRAFHSLGCGGEWKEDPDFDGWFDLHVAVVGVAAVRTEREIHEWVPRFPHNKAPEN